MKNTSSYLDNYCIRIFLYCYLFIFLNILAQVLPSWNVTIAYKTSSSLTIRWSNFPLSVPIQWFLVRYKEQNSSFSLIYKVSNWYNSHYSGSVLRTYQSYEVNVIAVANNSGNGAYSSEPTIARTNEGGKNQKLTATIDPTIKAKYNKLNKTFFHSLLFFFQRSPGKNNKQTKKQTSEKTTQFILYFYCMKCYAIIGILRPIILELLFIVAAKVFPKSIYPKIKSK